MAQMDLFGGASQHEPKPADDRPRRLGVLITVKAAPTPSASYGETVCVAGVSTDLERPGWPRLYPINFRYLEQDVAFNKYDVVTVEAIPAREDGRAESWKPRMGTLRVERHLRPWKPRRQWLDPLVTDSMCGMSEAATAQPPGPSLALIRPREVMDFVCEKHQGWSPDDQAKIDRYVNQLDIFDSDEAPDRTPLEAPRMKGAYRWRCWAPACRGHQQGMLDWEFVALQRRLRGLSDQELIQVLRQKFLVDICRPENDVAFFVGNQAKRRQTFSILGVYYPRRGR